MPPSIFNSVAQWILQRYEGDTPSGATEGEIAQSLSSLYASAGRCKACIMVPDLFPGASLEAIYVPKLGLKGARQDSKRMLPASVVTGTALAVIGAALLTHFNQTGNNMAHYEFDDGAQAVVYLPSERGTVLQALGLTLLEA